MSSNGGDHNEKRHGVDHVDNLNGSGEALSRQLTVQMSPEQYERLFFQPSAPRGDAAKRFGNPTVLGVLGFLIPFCPTIWSLLSWRGTTPTSTVAISGAYYFVGGIAMNLAGIAEFILGNTFPFIVFVIYGCHWCVLAYGDDSAHDLAAAFGPDGAASLPYNSGQAFYNVVMSMVSALIFLGALRTNIPFALAFLALVFLFAFVAAADFTVGYATSPADGLHAVHLLHIAGGFGMVTAISGWYLCIIGICESTGVPCPLPTMALTGLFVKTKAAKTERDEV